MLYKHTYISLLYSACMCPYNVYYIADTVSPFDKIPNVNDGTFSPKVVKKIALAPLPLLLQYIIL